MEASNSASEEGYRLCCRIRLVVEGIKKGEKVVAQGVGKLRDKTPIAPKPAKFEQIVESTKPVF